MSSQIQFDQDGQAFWDGRHVTTEDLRPILESFDSTISRQLLAWVERRMLKQATGILPESGILAQMAGLPPLYGLLDELERLMKPESWFVDRLQYEPDRPEEPVRPKKLRFSGGSQLAEIEDRQHRTAMERYRLDHWLWTKDDGEWQENQREFPRRIAKYGEFKEWARDRQRIEKARDKLKAWNERLEQCATQIGWEFFPPGPGMEYTLVWLRARLQKRFPEVRFDFGRIATLLDFRPQMLHFRSGDFDRGYIAFVFDNGIAALESPVIGNALYLFYQDWLELAQKPKRVLLDMSKEGDWRIARYFHSKDRDLAGWVGAKLRGLV